MCANLLIWVFLRHSKNGTFWHISALAGASRIFGESATIDDVTVPCKIYRRDRRHSEAAALAFVRTGNIVRLNVIKEYHISSNGMDETKLAFGFIYAHKLHYRTFGPAHSAFSKCDFRKRKAGCRGVLRDKQREKFPF